MPGFPVEAERLGRVQLGGQFGPHGLEAHNHIIAGGLQAQAPSFGTVDECFAEM